MQACFPTGELILSMDVGPARQPRSPLAFPSGGWATFPTLGMVPYNRNYYKGHRDKIKGEGGGEFSWGGVEGWSEKAHNCN